MKIGILTLPLHTNYGGILQAYALQTVLERMGHEVRIIERPCGCKGPFPLMCKIYIHRILYKFAGKYNGPINVERFSARKLSVVGKLTSQFINKNLKIFLINKTLRNMNENEFDAFVVGSDQIWRYAYTKGHFPYNEPFLDFAYNWGNKKRVAYAASFGSNKWTISDKDTRKCRMLIKKFDAVSVREDSGIELCRTNLHYNNVVKMIDPTMLLDASDYNRLIADQYQKRGNVLCYILDMNEKTSSFISKFCDDRGWSYFNANKKVDNESIPLCDRIQPSVESWLLAFRDCDYVLTDSFHACVFSILYRKPFVAFCNKSRGSTRFESLLSTFGLLDRLIYNIDNFDISSIKEIDYDRVFGILERERGKTHDLVSILNR